MSAGLSRHSLELRRFLLSNDVRVAPVPSTPEGLFEFPNVFGPPHAACQTGPVANPLNFRGSRPEPGGAGATMLDSPGHGVVTLFVVRRPASR